MRKEINFLLSNPTGYNENLPTGLRKFCLNVNNEREEIYSLCFKLGRELITEFRFDL